MRLTMWPRARSLQRDIAQINIDVVSFRNRHRINLDMGQTSASQVRYIGSRAIGSGIQRSGEGTPSVYQTPLDAPEASRVNDHRMESDAAIQIALPR
jgi:hypothetical protein